MQTNNISINPTPIAVGGTEILINYKYLSIKYNTNTIMIICARLPPGVPTPKFGISESFISEFTMNELDNKKYDINKIFYSNEVAGFP